MGSDLLLLRESEKKRWSFVYIFNVIIANIGIGAFCSNGANVVNDWTVICIWKLKFQDDDTHKIC